MPGQDARAIAQQCELDCPLPIHVFVSVTNCLPAERMMSKNKVTVFIWIVAKGGACQSALDVCVVPLLPNKRWHFTLRHCDEAAQQVSDKICSSLLARLAIQISLSLNFNDGPRDVCLCSRSCLGLKSILTIRLQLVGSWSTVYDEARTLCSYWKNMP